MEDHKFYFTSSWEILRTNESEIWCRESGRAESKQSECRNQNWNNPRLRWEESDLSDSTIRLSTHVNTGPAIFSFLKNTLNILKANQRINNKRQGVLDIKVFFNDIHPLDSERVSNCEALIQKTYSKKALGPAPKTRAPDVRVIVQMKEKILGLITNIHYEIQTDFHLWWNAWSHDQNQPIREP